MQDWPAVIEFLFLQDNRAKAWEVAQEYNQVPVYTQMIGDGAPSSEYTQVAEYCKLQQWWSEAGRMFEKAHLWDAALRAYMQTGNEKDVEAAVQVVKRLPGDLDLQQTLLKWLLGDVDGVAKNPRWVYKYYIALGKHAKAAQVAVIIAQTSQEDGAYKEAHSLLFQTHQDLLTEGLPVQKSVHTSLLLIHSYLITRRLVKLGNHYAAALMLHRVSLDIDKFPKHSIPILTSAVIECQKAEMKTLAYACAVPLVKPENRAKIDPRYTRKIELFVRSAAPTEDPPILSPPCPFCLKPLLDTETACGDCNKEVPYCIATGLHVLLDDFTTCPKCQFPARHSQLVVCVQQDGVCPMCAASLTLNQLTLYRAEEAEKFL
eukprot:Platyproteum_vivax@DN16064_c0_g1_i1.p1